MVTILTYTLFGIIGVFDQTYFFVYRYQRTLRKVAARLTGDTDIRSIAFLFPEWMCIVGNLHFISYILLLCLFFLSLKLALVIVAVSVFELFFVPVDDGKNIKRMIAHLAKAKDKRFYEVYAPILQSYLSEIYDTPSTSSNLTEEKIRKMLSEPYNSNEE